MFQKLMTLNELSEYLGVSEELLLTLVEEKVIPAYRIGGEFLRFQKEQIAAIRAEIDFRINKSGEQNIGGIRKEVRKKLEALSKDRTEDTAHDRITDFFYFNDFYIVSGVLVLLLVLVIFSG